MLLINFFILFTCSSFSVGGISFGLLWYDVLSVVGIDAFILEPLESL